MPLTDEQIAEWDANRERRESLVRRIAELMYWSYSQSPIYSGFRQTAIGNATVISNDKLEQIVNRLEAQSP